MAAEVKTKGVKTETQLSKTLHKKFRNKCKKQHTSMAQVLRDAAQAFVNS